MAENNLRTLPIGSGGGPPPMGRKATPQPITRWNGANMQGIAPERVMSIIKGAERGLLEPLFDLIAFVLETDTHVRSVYETPLRSVVSSPLLFDESKIEDPLSERALGFQRESLELLSRYERSMMHLAHAHGIGLAVGEKEWGRVRGAWRVVAIHPIDPRDTRFAADWTVEVRTWADGYAGQWISTADDPHSWIVHVPGSVGLRPNMSGILIPCLIPWVFKKFAFGYSQQALERFANRLLVGHVGPNATDDAHDALRNGLEDLTTGSTAVLSGEARVEALDVGSSSVGDAHIKFIRLLEEQITKGIMGSALNVDGGSDGGSYAMAISQGDTTVIPRVQSIADSLAETLREQWFAHELEVNAELFDGRALDPAEPYFRLLSDEPPMVDQLAVDGGVVTVDELRASKGLEPWGAEKGGDRIVTPIAKTAPAFSRAESVEDAPPPKSMGRQGRQTTSPSSRAPKTSPTFSPSTTQVGRVPFDR